jgi:hypothetical protein
MKILKICQSLSGFPEISKIAQINELLKNLLKMLRTKTNFNLFISFKQLRTNSIVDYFSFRFLIISSTVSFISLLDLRRFDTSR